MFMCALCWCCAQYPDLWEGADSVCGQPRGVEEWPVSGGGNTDNFRCRKARLGVWLGQQQQQQKKELKYVFSIFSRLYEGLRYLCIEYPRDG